MKPINFKLSLLLLFLILPSITLAQKDLITVTGTPESVKIDPSSLNHITLKAIGHDGKEHSYTGVLLSEILSNAGILMPPSRLSSLRINFKHAGSGRSYRLSWYE